jgi:deoxyribodipyrimidine photo-lyase
MNASILWFRQDLRLRDNPALAAAVARGGPVVPVYVWAPEEEGEWPPGAASRWWLHHSLASLDGSLRSRGSRLILRRGKSREILDRLARECSAAAIFWNRRYEPASVSRDAVVERDLLAAGREARSFPGALLFDPEEVSNQSGGAFQVFTPFWRSCLKRPGPPPPLEAPRRLVPPEKWPPSLPLASLGLEPRHDWAEGFPLRWRPGEDGAEARLRRFREQAASDYESRRDLPGREGTSGLSPHLHFGEISPRRIWHALQDSRPGSTRGDSFRGPESFLRQLGWREFAHHLLFHFPWTAERPLRPAFSRFPWSRSGKSREAWRRGRTGFPLVDAGMRQLWASGWMHNRVRMVVASFLVKDLRISWLEGARWFWDTLVDADLANNTLGWQWAAGCGADAAPYFRIFNPVSQGERFDPRGDYVRKWVPELRGLPVEWIQRPFEAPPEILEQAGIEPGKGYPAPMVDHGEARKRALAALATLRRRTT